MVVVASSGRGALYIRCSEPHPLPIARNRCAPARTGRGKGGAAAELGEGTLEAPEHAGALESAMGSLRERTSNHRQSRSL
jgi:hypothetical protein